MHHWKNTDQRVSLDASNRMDVQKVDRKRWMGGSFYVVILEIGGYWTFG